MSDTPEAISALRRRVAEHQASTLPQLIVEELENMIIAGALKGGDRINESALAMRLGVSRGPVREACRQLERSRLVEFRANRGMFIREISAEQATQLYDIRASLFGLAGRLAAAHVTETDVTDLRSLADRLHDATGEVDSYYPLNVDLHRRIVALARNPRLAELYDDVSKELHLFRRHGLETAAAREVSDAQHHEIVDRLATGDAAGAGRLMEEHILAGKQRMLSRMRD